MIKKFVNVTIKSDRYKKYQFNKMNGYAFKSISTMANHNDMSE